MGIPYLIGPILGISDSIHALNNGVQHLLITFLKEFCGVGTKA